MEINASLVIDIWELIVEYLPTNRKEDIANKMIKLFLNTGLDEDDFESIRGEDSYLDDAIDKFCESNNDEDDNDYESNDYEDD